jgi:hypothetical protein
MAKEPPGSSSTTSYMIATALPEESDGHFVRKGSCRKCGTIAYRKRQCARCSRKFCDTCTPRALQKYGAEEWEECCIGCEPCLVVTPPDSEPIFELEPESEEVALFSSSQMGRISIRRGQGPIHVPLSFFYDAPVETSKVGDSTNDCSGVKTSQSTECDSSEEGEEVSLYESIVLESFSHLPNLLLQQAPRTPTTTRDTGTMGGSKTAFDLALIEAPLTPQAGCCTACESYATGKRPCNNCGTKYCQESRCLAHLYEDGTCAKCKPSPREPSICLTRGDLPNEPGCCAVCQQFSIGKIPCESCGTKYCGEADCQAFLFTNGTCAVCHGGGMHKLLDCSAPQSFEHCRIEHYV